MAKRRKHRIFNTAGLTRAGWIRQQILLRPGITLTELQAAYEKTDFPKADRPKDMQTIYGSRNVLMKRYGWKSMDELPMNSRTGELNMAGLVRYYYKLHPETTDEELVNFLWQDGLEVKKYTIQYVKRHPEEAASTESPDENQDVGPRAGAETRRKRRSGKRSRRTKAERLTSSKDNLQTSEGIERTLEVLMAQAENLGKHRLFRAIRDARRVASATVLEYIG
jgi:hypothetical protein